MVKEYGADFMPGDLVVKSVSVILDLLGAEALDIETAG